MHPLSCRTALVGINTNQPPRRALSVPSSVMRMTSPSATPSCLTASDWETNLYPSTLILRGASSLGIRPGTLRPDLTAVAQRELDAVIIGRHTSASA